MTMEVFNAEGSYTEEKGRCKYQEFKIFNEVTGNSNKVRPLDWWRYKRGISDSQKLTCANVDCEEEADCGAHVIDFSKRQHVFIVPTCTACNNKTEELYEVDATLLEECTDVTPQKELIDKSLIRHCKITLDWATKKQKEIIEDLLNTFSHP